MGFLVQERSRISNMESTSSTLIHIVALVEFVRRSTDEFNDAIRRFESMFAPERLSEVVKGG